MCVCVGGGVGSGISLDFHGLRYLNMFCPFSKQLNLKATGLSFLIIVKLMDEIIILLLFLEHIVLRQIQRRSLRPGTRL